MNFINNIKSNAPTILTVGACVGAVAATALAIKNTIDAYDDIQEYMYSKTVVTDTYKEEKSIKDVLKHYIPTGIALLASIGCSVGSNVVHTKQNNTAIATLLSTISAMTIAKDYKNDPDLVRIRSVDGDNYMNPPYKLDDDEFIWVFEDFRNNQHDSYAGWFKVKRIDLERAEYQANRGFILNGEIKLKDFYELIRIEAHNSGYEMDENFGKYFLESDCDLMWSEYFESEDGYRWIDFCEDEVRGPGGELLYIILTYPFEPRIDLSECEYPTDEEIYGY